MRRLQQSDSGLIVPDRRPGRREMFTCGPAFFGGGGGDPYSEDVVMLLPCNGVNGSATLTDSASSAVWTGYSGATIATDAYQFGGSSAKLAHTSSPYSNFYTTSTSGYNVAASLFTWECWLNPNTTNNAYPTIIDFRGNSGSASSWSIFYTKSTGGVNIYDGVRGDTLALPHDNSAIAAGSWQHVAVMYDGTNVFSSVGGIINSAYPWAGPTAPASGARIGLDNTTSYYAGHIGPIRLTKSIVRYPSNFTPPATPFANY